MSSCWKIDFPLNGNNVYFYGRGVTEIKFYLLCKMNELLLSANMENRLIIHFKESEGSALLTLFYFLKCHPSLFNILSFKNEGLRELGILLNLEISPFVKG